MSSAVLRFAPSPNGYLHLGHAYSALYTDLWARQLGGTFLLRLEDTDITRCKPEFAQAMLEDLRWLGLDWPEPVMVRTDPPTDSSGKMAGTPVRKPSKRDQRTSAPTLTMLVRAT